MTLSMMADIVIVALGGLILLSFIGLIIIHLGFKVPMHENEMEDKLDRVIELLEANNWLLYSIATEDKEVLREIYSSPEDDENRLEGTDENDEKQ